MQMLARRVLIALFVWEFLMAMACATSPQAIIFFNGRITTLNADQSEASALAVVGDRIVAVGSDAEIKNQFGNPAEAINLHQKRVIPGFIESHGHFLGVGYAKLNLSLANTKSEAEIIQNVGERVATLGKSEWLKGRGWDQNDWHNTSFPTHHALSAIAPDNPVVLTRIDGHALWCNQAAMQIAGIDAQSQDPAGGKIIRDTSGSPTGVFIDNAMELILRRMPKSTPEQDKRAAKLAAAEALQFGITSFHDAGSGQQAIDVFHELLQAGQEMPRLYVMLNGDDPDLLARYFARGPQIDNRLSIRSIKLYADGALGSRGAALLEPYNDDPLNSGLLLISQDQLASATQQALRHGFQVATHAIGDKGNRLVLDAYETALEQTPNTNARLRIEHAQIVHPNDILRFKQLGVIASMQPTHCTSDMPWVPARLGEHRAKHEAYAWRSFLDQQVHFATGSDAPIESLNPLWGIYAAVTRQDHNGQPGDGFYPEQSLTLIEALEAFSVGGAFAEFQEHQKGRLAPGYLADFVVLNKDIFSLPTHELLSTKVEMTVLSGKIMHQQSF